VDVCRNCGAQTLQDLGFMVKLRHFFRVLNLERGMAPSAQPVKRFLRRMPFLSRAAQKIYGIQLAHVLEHVSFPLEITRKAARLLNDSGHLYIEVPYELDDDTMRRLNGGGIGIKIDIHEHINKYCQKSVIQLLRAAGLEPLEIQSEEVNFGWANANIIRALARKS
jgi:hypothetical protein